MSERRRLGSAAQLADLAARINAEFALSERAWRTSIQHAIKCGQLLLEAKTKVKAKFGHGHWLTWRKQNLPRISDSTAANYMRLARYCRDPAKMQRVANSSKPYRDHIASLTVRKRAVQSVEHYSPPAIVEAACRTMGGIDLDPASCAEANRTVRATQFFAKDDNALQRDWLGKVFLNAPWNGEAGPFVAKLIKECRAGRVKEAVGLFNVQSLDAQWFRPLWPLIAGLCIPYERIGFNGPGVEHQRPQAPCVIVYTGRNPDRFKRQFKTIGAVATEFAWVLGTKANAKRVIAVRTFEDCNQGEQS